jgi:hypothetical protein
MPSRKKMIDLQDGFASLNPVCPKCQAVIEPSQIRRVDFERMKCPFCDAVFKAGKRASGAYPQPFGYRRTANPEAVLCHTVQVMPERKFVILKYVQKVPFLASCTKCGCKFFTPDNYQHNPKILGKPEQAEEYLRSKFDQHECIEDNNRAGAHRGR